MTDVRKEDEIVVKKGKHGNHIKIDLGDYRAFISFALISVTVFLASTDNEAWREFALMTGMAVSYWFGQKTGELSKTSHSKSSSDGVEKTSDCRGISEI